MTSPYMPLYIADYLADAAHLTTEEHGAYLLLIMTYWQRGKPLPSDPARLANIARLPNERWTDVERTLSEFFNVTATEWRHKRIDAEMARYHDKVEKAKRAGKASAERRNETDAQRPSNGRSTDAQRPSNHSDSDLESEEEVKTPLPPKGGPTPSDALIAFEAYNATALRCGLQQASKLTPDRQRKIIARLRDFKLDGWHQALANIEKSSFLTGGNDTGFRANLDFMVQATSFAKLHDGAYGNGRHSNKSPEPKQAWQMPTRAPERRQADKEAEWAQMAIDQGIA